MKNSIFLIAGLAAILSAAAFLMVSCQNNEDEDLRDTVSVSGVAASYPLDGGTYSFTLKCSTEWTAEVVSDEKNYLTELKTTSGKADDGTKVMFTTYDAVSSGKGGLDGLEGEAVVRISNPKKAFEALDVTLKFTADPIEVKITIEGVEELYMMDGGTYSFTIKSNRPWKIAATDNSEGYITSLAPEESAGDENGTAVQFVTYDAPANNRYNLSGTVNLEVSSPADEFPERYVEIKLKSEELVPNISVENVADYYIMDGSAGGFTLKSNVAWNARVESGSDYITLDTESGTPDENGTAIKFTTIDDSQQTPTGRNASARIIFDFVVEGVESVGVDIKLISIAREANCYAVAPNSYFIIPVSRANDAEVRGVTGSPLIGAGDTVEAKLLWISDPKAVDPASCVAEIGILGSGENALLTIKTGTAKGNALVGAAVSGDVKWSWHIWVVDDPGTIYNTASGSHAKATGYDVTYEMTWMDRNLGALAPASAGWSAVQGDPTVGLYYQWGRKDPFDPHSAYDFAGDPVTLFVERDITPTLTDAMNTPMVTYSKWEGSNGAGSWVKGGAAKGITNNAKTVFDPCPDGWRVPEIGITTDYPGYFGPCVFGKGGDPDYGGSNSWGAFSNKGRSFLASGQFFPAAGNSNISGIIENFGTSGYYFTATRAKSSSPSYVDPSTRGLIFTNANVRTNDGISVFVVASLRCVKEY